MTSRWKRVANKQHIIREQTGNSEGSNVYPFYPHFQHVIFITGLCSKPVVAAQRRGERINFRDASDRNLVNTER